LIEVRGLWKGEAREVELRQRVDLDEMDLLPHFLFEEKKRTIRTERNDEEEV